MNASNYIEVLRSNLPHSALKLALTDSYHFQQDNDQAHCQKYKRMVAV
jgi:hypothetical protein